MAKMGQSIPILEGVVITDGVNAQLFTYSGLTARINYSTLELGTAPRMRQTGPTSVPTSGLMSITVGGGGQSGGYSHVKTSVGTAHADASEFRIVSGANEIYLFRGFEVGLISTANDTTSDDTWGGFDDLSSGGNGSPANGVNVGDFINELLGRSAVGGVASAVVATQDLTNYHKYRFTWASGSVTFYKDGASVGTVTANVPISGYLCKVHCFNRDTGTHNARTATWTDGLVS